MFLGHIMMSDAADSYMTGFEDAIAQATCIYPESDFSQLGVGKIVTDGRLIDEEEEHP